MDGAARRRRGSIEVFTGPEEPAGRYLRRFWQPVYHAVDLKPGRPVPLRIMGEDFTHYRGESGAAALVAARCPHRGTRLASGRVEGDDLRCFYHGWKFAPDGRCIEQPAEDPAFCHKVTISAYPVREYLGLLFAYLGPGAPPELPRYPEFERFAGIVELDSYYRPCNYFQNLENALDMSHVGFVHGGNVASFRGIGHGARLGAEESSWGVRYSFARDDGAQRVQQFGMPNVFYMNALPNDPEIGWQESLFWWVPIDDEKHMQFSIHRIPATGDTAERIKARRQRRRSEIDLAHQTLARDILAGRLAYADVDRARVDVVRLEDDIAQLGQGAIADREHERPGRADVGVIAVRKLWERELAASADGRATTPWRREPGTVPSAWGVAGGAARHGAEGTATDAEIRPEVVDVRPFVEVAIQLKALHGEADPA